MFNYQFCLVCRHSRDSKDSFPGDSRSDVNCEGSILFQRCFLTAKKKKRHFRRSVLTTTGLHRLYSLVAECDSGRYRSKEVRWHNKKGRRPLKESTAIETKLVSVVGDFLKTRERERERESVEEPVSHPFHILDGHRLARCKLS